MPKKNSAEGHIQAIDQFIYCFEKGYAEAVEKGQVATFMTEAMKNGNVCFEARAQEAENYYMKYGKDGIGDMDKIRRNYRPVSSFEQIMTRLTEEFNELWLETHGQDEPYERKDLEQWLLQKEDVVGYKFRGGAGENFAGTDYAGGINWDEEVEITPELLGKFMDYQADILGIL